MFPWRCPAAFFALIMFLLPAAGRAAQAHNIAVFGDSLADGVWAGIYQEEKANPQDRLFRDSKVGTGLTRPDYDSFVAGFIATLDPDHVTDAVVMFGANDDEGRRCTSSGCRRSSLPASSVASGYSGSACRLCGRPTATRMRSF
jgi:hypothetical protein